MMSSLYRWFRSRSLTVVNRLNGRKKPTCKLHVEALEERTLLSAGVLDPTFGSGGLVTTAGSSPYDLVAQADGKLVITGKAGLQSFVARYKDDGSLDPTFGSGGKTLVTLKNTNASYGNAIAVQADGKYVVAGAAMSNSTTGWDFLVMRFNVNGTLDKTFDRDGIVTTDFAHTADTAATVVALPDGKILVGGKTNGTSGIALARYNANGSLDTSFGSGGKRTYSPAGSLVSMALQNDGKIVMAEWTWTGTGGGTYATTTVLRINPDGNPDTGFGSGGVVTTQVTANGNQPFDLALTPDGKIVVVGDASLPGVGWFQMILRYNANGSPDTTFDGDGAQTSASGVARSVAVQPDGKIITAGHTQNANGASSQTDLILTRVSADGRLDASFGTGGQVVTKLVDGPEMVYAVALQGDGKIVVAAEAPITTLARYTSAAPVIGSFTAVAAGSEVTLTASNITDANPGSTITQVAFYEDTNGDSIPDSLLGYGIQTSPGIWTLTFSATGWTSGTHRIFAVALDDYGIFSDPLALDLQVI